MQGLFVLVSLTWVQYCSCNTESTVNRTITDVSWPEDHEQSTIKSNLSAELVALESISARRGYDWDLWCIQQYQIGDCNNSRINRWYYDAQLDQCRLFDFSGCHPNRNNFDTLKICEKLCKGTGYRPFKAKNQEAACTLQAKPGMCVGTYLRYYFDINMKKCKEFIYGGCEGNENRFDSESECYYMCRLRISYT